MYIYDNMSLNYYYNENVLEKFVEKIRTHFYGKYIFFSWKSCVYEIMSKNILEPERPRMVVRNTAQVLWMLDN